MKRAIVLLAAIFVVTIHPVQAVQAYEGSDTVQNSGRVIVMPMADVIVTKYRLHNGLVQYRRWNKTQGCWVDPDWIDFG